MKRKVYGTPIRILRGDDIIKAVNENYLFISPFDVNHVQPTSYDVTISKLVKYTDREYYSIDDNEQIIEDFEDIYIQPQEAYLFLSESEFRFPNDMIATISLRSRFSRLLNSGEYMGRVECGWAGKLVLEVSNHSTSRIVKISRGDALATLEIFQLDSQTSQGYQGKYMNWPDFLEE